MRIEKIEPVTPRPILGSRQANGEADTHLTISGEDRDALYGIIISHLTGFDDLRKAYEDRNHLDLETCHRTGRKICDGLRLIEDAGLGWGSELGRDAVELRLSPEELTPLFERLRTDILTEVEVRQPEHETGENRMSTAQRACDEVLRRLHILESAQENK